MRPILLDTNAYGAFIAGMPEVVETLARADRVLLCSTVIGELLAGFAAGTRQAQNRAELAEFMATPRLEVVPATAQTAESYALIYAALRKKGKPIPTNDLWIAASALEHGAALLTLDAHFNVVDGLHSGRQMADFLP
jgi:tRNA(fMet)-specific endonuclease VapC